MSPSLNDSQFQRVSSVVDRYGRIRTHQLNGMRPRPWRLERRTSDHDLSYQALQTGRNQGHVKISTPIQPWKCGVIRLVNCKSLCSSAFSPSDRDNRLHLSQFFQIKILRSPTFSHFFSSVVSKLPSIFVCPRTIHCVCVIF